MRHCVLAFAAVVGIAAGSVTAGQTEKIRVELQSGLVVGGLALPESDKPVHGFRLTAQVDKVGEGIGTLEFDPNAPSYSEFGYLSAGAGRPWVKLECTLKFVKKGIVRVRTEPRVAAPEVDIEWLLFEVVGPKIKSKLFVARPGADNWKNGRFLVHDKDSKVRYAVEAWAPAPPPPCHPGCFPAGTAIRVADGTRAVERVRAGDLVTTVGADGKTSPAKVESVFVTRNRLLKVTTDAGDLLTTETQPLALAGGGLRAAGELKAGDRVFRWDGTERRPTTVRSVTPTGREEDVFNLILADPALFVANGFLARSKPPAPATTLPDGPGSPRE